MGGCFSMFRSSGDKVSTRQEISLCMYFKVEPQRVEDWKRLYYGFTFQDVETFGESQTAFWSEDYATPEDLFAHLANIPQVFEEALTMSELERIEVSAPPEYVPEIENHQSVKDYGITVYTYNDLGYRKKRKGFFSKECILKPYYEVVSNGREEFGKYVDLFEKRTMKEKGNINCFFSLTNDGGWAHSRESFVDASSLVTHLSNTGDIFAAFLMVSNLYRMEVHGPEKQLKPLKENKILMQCGATFYETDDRGTDDAGQAIGDDAEEEMWVSSRPQAPEIGGPKEDEPPKPKIEGGWRHDWMQGPGAGDLPEDGAAARGLSSQKAFAF